MSPDLFDNLFEGKNVPSEKIKGFKTQFSMIIFLQLLALSDKHLDSEEKKHVNQLAGQGSFDEVFKMLQSKYTQSEWEQLVEQEFGPIVDGYLSEVVQ
jgi:hypothetical protein